MTESFMGYQSPKALEKAIKESESPSEGFRFYAEGLFTASICSSLPLEVVKARMSRVISGTTLGWTFSDKKFPTGESNPCPCDLQPATHTHYLFDA